jgi:hypothetical protein
VLLYLHREFSGYCADEVDETLGACRVRFRDTVLGPGSGQRPMRATIPDIYVN